MIITKLLLPIEVFNFFLLLDWCLRLQLSFKGSILDLSVILFVSSLK